MSPIRDAAESRNQGVTTPNRGAGQPEVAAVLQPQVLHDDRIYLTIQDAEHSFGISRFTLWRLIKSGKIRATKLTAAKSGKVLINKNSVESYFMEKQVKGAQR